MQLYIELSNECEYNKPMRVQVSQNLSYKDLFIQKNSMYKMDRFLQVMLIFNAFMLFHSTQSPKKIH